MRVGLIDVDGEGLERVAAGIRGAETAVADVRDPVALTAAIDALADRLGGLDVAVANAGIASGGPLRLVAAETVEETIDINLLGVWRTVRAALPHVLERRGHLLLVASAAAVLPTGGLGAYSAAKAGVEALGRSLRIELRPHDVSVAVAYYLFLNTPMVAAGQRSPVFQSTQRADAAAARPDVGAGAGGAAHGGVDRAPLAQHRPPALPARPDGRARPAGQPAPRPREVARSMPDMEAAFEREAERVGPYSAARPR